MRRTSVLVILFIAAFCLQAILAVPRLSATSDELAHLAAGYSYWQTLDFRMNPEHPPLAKLVATLPLLFIRPAIDTSHSSWVQASQWIFGFIFLYYNDADRLLFWSRMPMIALAALGALVSFLWARDLFGAPAGVFAAGLYAFSPNLLAHGMLVTTDVPLGTFYLLLLYLFWKQGDHPTWRSNLVIGLFLGAVMATKYSGAFVPFLLVILTVLRAWRPENRSARMKSEIQGLCIVAAASLFVIEAAYLFTEWPAVYVKNSAFVNANHPATYLYFLLGDFKPNGWWYYFFVAFALKATAATLLVLSLAVLRSFAGFINRRGETILLLGIGFYVAVIALGANDIGIRYLLPVFPLLFVWGSRIVPECLKTRAGTALLVALLACQAWAGLTAFPNYIPYFNEWAGGPRRGPDYLDDSNVDWGQGIKQAAEYVKQRGLKTVSIWSFSPFDNPAYYGLPPNVPEKDILPRLLRRPPEPGVYILSAHNLIRIQLRDPAWKIYQPTDRIGDSLWVFEFH